MIRTHVMLLEPFEGCDGPLGVLLEFTYGPRGPLVGSKGTQDTFFRKPQEAPKRLQESPKRAQTIPGKRGAVFPE